MWIDALKGRKENRSLFDVNVTPYFHPFPVEHVEIDRKE